MEGALKVELIHELEAILSDIADGYTGEAKFAITLLKDRINLSANVDPELKKTMLRYLDEAWRALIGGYSGLGAGAFLVQNIRDQLAAAEIGDPMPAAGRG